MKFYLSRNRHDTYVTLTNYKPKRNPQYDNFECDDGRVLHQNDLGTWYYWGEYGENQRAFTDKVNDKVLHTCFGVNPEDIPECTCLDLTENTLMKLEDAEAI